MTKSAFVISIELTGLTTLLSISASVKEQLPFSVGVELDDKKNVVVSNVTELPPAPPELLKNISCVCKKGCQQLAPAEKLACSRRKCTTGLNC